MLKVALIGAPSSGKTALAQQLAEAFSPRSVEIVDGYIEALTERTSLVFGHYATYLGNLQCACARHEAEYMARQRKPDMVITCGTLVENSVYTAVHAYIQANINHQSGTAAINDRRAYIVMTWLAMMSHDLWDYDAAFYLPAKDEDNDSEAIDSHILESVETFNLKVIELDDPQTALATVLQRLTELDALAPVD